MFLQQFLQEPFNENDCSGRDEPHMQEFVGFGIDGGVQSVALVVEVNHRLVESNVIRVLPVGWL